MDEFEQRLHRQPQRRLPPHWREPILRAARAAAGAQPPPLHSRVRAWWHAGWTPTRLTWAGMAVTWAVIAALHLAARMDEPAPVPVAQVPAGPEVRGLLAEQRRLLAELLLVSGHSDDPQRDQPVDRPRSERRLEPGFPTSGHFTCKPQQALT